MFTQLDYQFMEQAIKLAQHAASIDEVPVGAILVLENQIIGQGWNSPINSKDPTAHAELIALRSAAKALGNYRLINSTLYVTLEPCMMCAGALIHARIKRLVFGAFDKRAGAIESCMQILDFPFLNHKVQYAGGLLADNCGQLLSHFFQDKRAG